MFQDLTPEDRFCLLLARAHFSPVVTEEATRQIEAGVSWERAQESARTHGLLPLVYKRLCDLKFQGVPPPVRRELTDTFGVNAMRNVRLAQEQSRVLIQLGSAGVPAIPLKGIALAESLYGDPGLRVIADLDILIRPEHLEASLHVLESIGYEPHFANPRFVQSLARFGKDCALMREDERQAYPLQIHCGLIWGGQLEARLLPDFWTEAVPCTWDRAPAWAPAREWEFLYLAIHAARHRFWPLKWLVDLDWIVARGGVDWTKVHKIGRRLGWQNSVLACFAACRAWLDTAVPEPFANANTATVRSAISRPGPLTTPRETLFCVRLLPRLSQRCHYLATRIFIATPADAAYLPLPDSLFFLYLVLRPLRLAGGISISLIRGVLKTIRQLLGAQPQNLATQRSNCEGTQGR